MATKVMDMSVINKELYDALREANVSDEKATAAAASNTQADIADIKARLSVVEKLQWGILLGIIGLFIKSFLV